MQAEFSHTLSSSNSSPANTHQSQHGQHHLSLSSTGNHHDKVFDLLSPLSIDDLKNNTITTATTTTTSLCIQYLDQISVQVTILYKLEYQIIRHLNLHRQILKFHRLGTYHLRRMTQLHPLLRKTIFRFGEW